MMTVPAAASHHSAGMLAEICTAAGTVSRAKRRALLLTRKGVPVVLDMKLILRDAARSDAGKSHPSPVASATPAAVRDQQRPPAEGWVMAVR